MTEQVRFVPDDKSYPIRNAAGTARHARKKNVRTYPADHRPTNKRKGN